VTDKDVKKYEKDIRRREGVGEEKRKSGRELQSMRKMQNTK